jgi:hypothetical protein
VPDFAGARAVFCRRQAELLSHWIKDPSIFSPRRPIGPPKPQRFRHRLSQRRLSL